MSAIAPVDVLWLDCYSSGEWNLPEHARRELAALYAARDIEPNDEPTVATTPFEYVARAAPDESNLDLPAFLQVQAE